MAVGMIVDQPVAQPQHRRVAEIAGQQFLDLGLAQVWVAVVVEQALLGGDDQAGAVAVDCAAFEDPAVPLDMEMLARDLGYTSVLWLGDGLVNDHTDGHVDNLARFIGENRLLIPEAADNDPNWRIYQDAARRAEAFGVELVRMPSPGRVLNAEEDIVPASYMNFYIGNAAVVVPLYGQDNDTAAVETLRGLFPGREVIGIRAGHILTGGGSFHCISQQIPSF
jgi:hypothetical protein